MHRLALIGMGALGLATDLGFVAGVAALLAITVLYCAEVALRYVFNAPTSWGLDVVSFLFLISIYAVVPHATRARGHIAVTLIQDRFPALGPAWSRAIAGIAVLLCGIAGWASLQENFRQFIQNVETIGALSIPKWWLSAWISYCFGLSMLWFLHAAAAAEPKKPILPFLKDLA